MDAPTLKPAHEIARANPVRFPNESAAYRQARNALLAEEIELLAAARKARGWSRIRVVSDTDGDYTRDYVSREDADVPAYNVFTRRDGTIRHIWASEMYASSTDPGQDPRGAPDLDPLWTLLDTTPEGRGKDWYPKLSYT